MASPTIVAPTTSASRKLCCRIWCFKTTAARIVFQALDAVGVHLIVVGVMVVDPALKVAL